MFSSASNSNRQSTNSPLKGAAVKPISTSTSTTSPLVFEMDTIPFLYDKKTKQWIELEEGRTAFAFDRNTSSITIRTIGTSNASQGGLNHRVALTVQVQKQIAQTKSWVFRAMQCETESHDVLCLQLCENAQAFLLQYERHRARCLVEMQTPSTSTTAAAAATTRMGRDLSPVGTMDLCLTRRLSTIAGEARSPGARYEPAARASPSKLSPMRSNNNATAAAAPTQARSRSVLYSGISVKGTSPTNPDKPNQDAMVLHQLPSGELVFAVFDGHGSEGHDVSRYLKTRLPKLLATAASSSSSSSQEESLDDARIADCLDRAERELIDNCKVDTTLSGSTGVIVILGGGNELIVANVGDSRAVVGLLPSAGGDNNRAWIARDLTEDHKPDSPLELKRIKDVGGRVFAIKFDDGIDGPARVWLSYADYPGLAMSRSICDTIAKEAGVISKPDIKHEQLTSLHKCLIIASDGLWEFMTSQEVVDIVAKHCNGGGAGPDPEAAVQELVRESSKRWRLNEPVVDDTTIIVAFFV